MPKARAAPVPGGAGARPAQAQGGPARAAVGRTRFPPAGKEPGKGAGAGKEAAADRPGDAFPATAHAGTGAGKGMAGGAGKGTNAGTADRCGGTATGGGTGRATGGAKGGGAGRRPGGRLVAIDLARSAALLGMAAYHFSYDLEIFGWLPPGTVVSGGFWWLARLVAGAFIFIAGMGLWLSHGEGIRWGAFWRRLLRIGAAAALVTAASRAALPEVVIFYGILHSIAVSSLAGLLFLRLPAGLVLVAAAAAFALPRLVAIPALGGWLVWTGLSGTIPATADFEPFFPWFGPFLLGLAAGKLVTHLDAWDLLARPRGAVARWLAAPGRHSLAVYLIHQPVLIALVFAFTWIWWRV